jgi:alpha-L-fucosidase 2
VLKIFTLIFVAFLILNPADGLSQKSAKNNIRSSFDPHTATWNISWPGRISQYDLVYLSPPVDPLQGIPLGNGDAGVLFWCENSKIIAAVNKSDLWDDASFGPFRNWSREEEDYSTTQRHACRLVIDFKYPVFNTLYLSDFKARLSLADGSLSLQADGAFGKVSLKAFIDHDTGLLFYNIGSDLNEDVPVEVSVERFGSRTFSHWYNQINRDASIGLSGTETAADTNGVFITQKLSSGTFASGGCVIHDNGLKIDYSREHSRCALIKLSGNSRKEAWLAFTFTSPVSGNVISEAKEKLKAARERGPDGFLKSNEQAWKSLWERSFIDYGDDYLNNLWYLTMYYANASQGGKYPGRFNNGLWSWNNDVQNWNFYFHWNQQQLFWPLNAAGFHELLDPYLSFRFNSLPHARKDASDIFNARGAFISDVTERRGYNSASENANHTPVAEIALDFWRQYRYTCNKEFLKDKALPFIIEAARFYESLLEKEADGLYHARKGTGYEGWIELKDGLTELVYARVLFKAALEALKEADHKISDAERWKEIIGNLAPLPAIKAGNSSISEDGTGFRLMRGFKKGAFSPSDSILAAGWGIKENRYLTVYYPVDDTINFGLKLLDGIFPSVPSSPVFPSGLIGLKQKGSNMYNKVVATTLLYGREITGWDPVPVVMARLGMGKELAMDLNLFPARWQIYCNGWGHWGVEGEVNKDAEWFFRTNMVRDVANPEGDKFPLPMWPFRHMSMESMSVFATAVNESLLQSYDGVIRVFPAFPADKKGRFTLHAEGGFIVSSEIISGEVQWVSIKSLYGKNCRIEIPWNNATETSNLRKKGQKITEKIAEIKTMPGELILLTGENADLGKWTLYEESPVANGKVRYHWSGKTRLGIPRMF